MLETIEKILKIAGSTASIVGFFVGICLFIKIKLKSKPNKLEALGDIVKEIPFFIDKAEKLFPSNNEVKMGNFKFNWVLEQIEKLAGTKKFKKAKNEIKKEINDVVDKKNAGMFIPASNTSNMPSNHAEPIKWN
ncbi:hypothetical protein [Mycoplasmopsis lipofaciens]|uniref:hypothetical protein n=1 Tax=Mycoplasmopsis lipofaciens TaxID=114884 RepID=UPI000484A283|nr:hypothetical protein [Mycoplasmopsis lipofaciens]